MLLYLFEYLEKYKLFLSMNNPDKKEIQLLINDINKYVKTINNSNNKNRILKDYLLEIELFLFYIKDNNSKIMNIINKIKKKMKLKKSASDLPSIARLSKAKLLIVRSVWLVPPEYR